MTSTTTPAAASFAAANFPFRDAAQLEASRSKIQLGSRVCGFAAVASLAGSVFISGWLFAGFLTLGLAAVALHKLDGQYRRIIGLANEGHAALELNADGFTTLGVFYPWADVQAGRVVGAEKSGGLALSLKSADTGRVYMAHIAPTVFRDIAAFELAVAELGKRIPEHAKPNWSAGA